MHALFLSVCLVALTASHAWANSAPARVLLLQERGDNSPEQAVVHQALLQALLNDPQVDVMLPTAVQTTTRRSADLRRAGCGELSQAKRDFERRHLKDAQGTVNRAAQKLWRVAALSGDVAPWLAARALQAAVYAARGRDVVAQALLTDVLAMDPDYRLEGSLDTPAMRRRMAQTQRVILRSPILRIPIKAQPAGASLWADGRFIGFGQGYIDAPANTPHVVLATYPGHIARVQTVVAKPWAGVQLDLVSEAAPPSGASYAELVESARIPSTFPDPNSPILSALNPTGMWVLRYEQGAFKLAAFDMSSGRRHERVAPATIVDLTDAHRTAQLLLAQPLALPDLERPPT